VQGDRSSLSLAVVAVRSRLLMLRFVLLLVLALVAASCKKAEATAEDPPAPAASATPPEVTDKSTGLLLTWVDDKGEFHVEQKVDAVPADAREAVGVRDETHAPPPGKVFLADLRATSPDGKYTVKVADAVELENVAVERRRKTGKAVLAPTPPSSAAVAPPGSAVADTGRPTVIIYGASWCGPCHQAQAYMRRRGINFVEKDIEEDPGAAQEMREKLTKAGKRGGSIPVIDVKGTILIGFDPGSVERALR